MKRKGFIFDLDGVIVDTAKYHFLAWKNLAHSMGFDFTQTQNEQLKGVSRVDSLNKILAWGNTTVSEDKFQALMTLKNDEYLGYIDKMDDSEILIDVPKVLDFLKQNNQGIALGSASKNARRILEKVKLISKFDAIVDGNDVSKAKPDPEVFLNAASAITCDPKDCVVFEDSVAGVQAANRANMISIGIGSRAVLHEADYVFNDFSEISEDFIKELINQ
ncbi:beta-phosphoglucomutase [Tamlana sp. s12]|uniref:beta-phosphoglucomutase n=1 Tax=Tamlana sp. s12 TaxID=1630406 RepID=UPI0007FBA7BC|nr:beta-phosphoglucomutase [Tamlana sp. s12]OBQ52182.1 beta-phosphoglucomutase [Tamlana sp. s12]QQY82286.1 beta-phosphoglucomutase [Tamlana sp. s12]